MIGGRRDNLSGALGGTLLLSFGRPQKPRLKTAHQARKRQGNDQIEQGGNHIRRDGARRGHDGASVHDDLNHAHGGEQRRILVEQDELAGQRGQDIAERLRNHDVEQRLEGVHA